MKRLTGLLAGCLLATTTFTNGCSLMALGHYGSYRNPPLTIVSPGEKDNYNSRVDPNSPKVAPNPRPLPKKDDFLMKILSDMKLFDFDMR